MLDPGLKLMWAVSTQWLPAHPELQCLLLFLHWQTKHFISLPGKLVRSDELRLVQFSEQRRIHQQSMANRCIVKELHANVAPWQLRYDTDIVMSEKLKPKSSFSRYANTGCFPEKDHRVPDPSFDYSVDRLCTAPPGKRSLTRNLALYSTVDW